MKHTLSFSLTVFICCLVVSKTTSVFSEYYAENYSEDYYPITSDEYIEAPQDFFLESPWNHTTESPGFQLRSSKECCSTFLYPRGHNPSDNNQGHFVETPWENPDQVNPTYPGVTIESYYVPKREDLRLTFEVNEEEESTSANQEDANDISAKNEPKSPYRLKIGDQLQVSLYGFRDAKTDRVVTVDPTGTISYLFVNKINALGKTIDEVRKEIEEKAKLQYPHVIATASALQLNGDSYTIMGEVNIPGTKPVTGNSTVLSAIAVAGGFPLRAFRSQTIDYADLDRSFVARNGEYVPVDFNKLIREGDISQDVHLEGGDYIYIPSLIAKEIYVLGEFYRPFVYSYIKTASLTEVVTWARGLTPLASSRVAVIRGSLGCPTTYLVDVNLIFHGAQPDFLLCPGDIVYAPPAKFGALKQIVRAAISMYVGAIATQAGENSFFKIQPEAAGQDNNNFFFNPALIPQQQSQTVIIGQ